MNDNPEPSPTPQEAFHKTSELDPGNLQNARFFGRTDWLSFGVTAVMVLAVYLFTLAPDVTLGNFRCAPTSPLRNSDCFTSWLL